MVLAAKRILLALLCASAAEARRPAPLALEKHLALDKLLRGGESAQPSSAEALKILADDAQRSGDLETAATCYVEALDAVDEAAPDQALVAASIRLNLARCRLRRDEFEAAIECCDAVLKTAGPRSPLRAVALYRRAAGHDGLGDGEAAYVDAAAAATLGSAKAAALAEKHKALAPKIATPLGGLGGFGGPMGGPLGGPMGGLGGPMGGLGGGAGGVGKQLAKLFDDPKKARQLVPLVRSLGTAQTLEKALGLPRARAEKLASALQNLDEDGAEKWARRVSRVVAVSKRCAAALRFAKAAFPKALYGFVVYWLASDSARLLLGAAPA